MPTDDDIKALEDYGVKTVIDLRGDYEAEDTPTSLSRIKGSQAHHISLFELNVADAETNDLTLAQSYELIIDKYKVNVVKILNAIADAQQGAILYHCFFGKDRTGILSMLLLHIAGVSTEDIVADYQQSYTYVLPYIKSHLAILWSTDRTMHYSLPETMSELINYIDEKYGSIDNYILDIGVSDCTINKIRDRLLNEE